MQYKNPKYTTETKYVLFKLIFINQFPPDAGEVEAIVLYSEQAYTEICYNVFTLMLSTDSDVHSQQDTHVSPESKRI